MLSKPCLRLQGDRLILHAPNQDVTLEKSEGRLGPQNRCQRGSCDGVTFDLEARVALMLLF